MRRISIVLSAIAACAGGARRGEPSYTETRTEVADPAPLARPTRSAPAPAGVDAALVAAHNRVRAKHCAPPLAWSAQLAAIAQKWANHLRDGGCLFEHSRTEYGENLAAGTDGALDPDGVVGMWYGEIAKYDFRHGGFSMDTGHFTQVVWRDTARVGCGTSRCNGMTIWVCNYDPPGNVEGEYRENVQSKACR